MSGTASSTRTLIDKLWDAHVIESLADGEDLLYVDLHLIHEVTSPQAFEGLRASGRRVRRPDLTFATMDHNVPTSDRNKPVEDELSKLQMDTLRDNCAEFEIPLVPMRSPRQGIVHVIGPEFGLTRPGMTIVCGDSHTATHGAFGALAFGIGTSEVEHVLAAQCLPQARPKSMAVRVTGQLPPHVTSKDLILSIINEIGTAGGSGHAIEYSGDAITSMSMESRMTVCNMSIEAGARAGLIAPDDTTLAYLADRVDLSEDEWARAVTEWAELRTDAGASFDRTCEIDASTVEPMVTWGTTPAMSVPVSGRVPLATQTVDPGQARRAMAYMGVKEGQRVEELMLDRVFIGSCTNGRIEDLRQVAQVAAGGTVHPRVRAMVVPGSYPVKLQAEREGIDEVLVAAGFEWREPGCSMCLGMNPDLLDPGERCASTSNRNFEGRQGPGGRTHLVSPAVAAASALAGHISGATEEGTRG